MSDIIKDEFMPQDDARTVATSVGKSMIRDKSYAKLSEGDLGKFGVLQGKDFSEYMLSELRLRASLQGEALEQMTAHIPPPVDTDVVYKAQKREVLSESEEMAVRLGNLKGQDTPLTRIKEESSGEIRDFAYKVLASAGYYKTEDDNSFDPEQLKGNLTLMEKITSQVPGIITVDGNQYFALYVPREVRDEFASFFVAMLMGPPPIENYIVVTDPDKNSELASELYNNDDLLRYYLADGVARIQRETVSDIERTFSDVASKKYDEAKKELEKADAPVKKYFLDLLIKDAANGDMVLTRVFRDHHDVATLQGRAKPKVDRTGTESSATSYQLSSPESGVLGLEFEDVEVSWGEADQETHRRPQINNVVQEHVEVRFNENSQGLEYRYRNKDGELTEWGNQEGQYNGPAYRIKMLLGGSVFSLSQRLEHGTKVRGEMQKISNELTRTRSSVEFCNKLKELGLAGYPSTEYVVNNQQKTKFVFDVFPPQYLQDSFTNN